MKNMVVFLFVFGLYASGVPSTKAFAEDQFLQKTSTANRVVFYEDPGYRGKNFTVYGNDSYSDLGNKRMKPFKSWNDQISSVRIYGNVQAILFRDKNKLGSFISLTESNEDLTSVNGMNWDNKASSAWIFGDSKQKENAQAIFYDKPGFAGHSLILYGGDSIRKLRDKDRGSRWKDWDDEIASIRLIGATTKVTLYEDDKYSGEKLVVKESVSDINKLDSFWDNRASSVRVAK